MNFRTVVNIKKESDIQHCHKVLMFGSCFTEHIGKRLVEHLFQVKCNPLGILFNPASIFQSIERIVQNQFVRKADLIETDGVWNCYDFHSQFARLSANDYLQNINEQINETHHFLKECDFIFITLGTAWTYRLNRTGKIVGNCHKSPSNLFSRKRLTVSDCVDYISKTILQIREVNPNVNFVFTISPIRHWKDGAHGNQLSKSTLLLALDEVCQKLENCNYFPSYEILMDDLRDYRFYANDMLHPNEIAQEYIWDKFGDCFFSEETKSLNKEIRSILLALQHRPFNPESSSYQKFVEQTQKRIKDLEEKYPFIRFSMSR